MTQGFGHDHAVRVIKPAATVVLRFGQAQIAQGTEFAKYLMRRKNFSSFPFVYMRVDFINDKALEVTFEFFVFMGTTIRLLFLCAAPSLVLASKHIQSACKLLVIHILPPLMM